MNSTTVKSVETLMAGLLGREVKAAVKPLGGAEMPIVGTYRSDGDAAVAACSADVAFAATSSAALSLFPPGIVEDCLESGEVDDEDLRDNYGEVLNVFARIFTEGDSRRVVLKSTYFDPGELPGGVSEAMANAANRMDLELDIQGYGKGRVSLMQF